MLQHIRSLLKSETGKGLSFSLPFVVSFKTDQKGLNLRPAMIGKKNLCVIIFSKWEKLF